MKKFKDCFIPSKSELKRAAAHLRNLQNSVTDSEGLSSTYFRCYFLPETCKFIFHEYCDCHSYTVSDSEMMLEIPSSCGAGWESVECTPDQILSEIEYAIMICNCK